MENGENILQKQRNLNIRAIQSDIKVVFWDKWYYNKGYEKQRRKKDGSRSNKNNDNWRITSGSSTDSTGSYGSWNALSWMPGLTG